MAEPEVLSRRDVIALGAALRGAAEGASSMEEVAQRIVHHLYSSLRHRETGEPFGALIRLFKTHPFQHLPPSLQSYALRLAGDEPLAPETRCLTLLATAGEDPAWNARQTSAGHQAIPLMSEEMVLQSPMIAQLFLQFGIEPRQIVASDKRLVLHSHYDSYNIFHVPVAAESPFVPAQDTFVQPFQIASVVGFGGPLTEGDLFAIILFSKAPLNLETASLFSSIALSAKLALLSAHQTAIFAPED